MVHADPARMANGIMVGGMLSFSDGYSPRGMGLRLRHIYVCDGDGGSKCTHIEPQDSVDLLFLSGVSGARAACFSQWLLTCPHKLVLQVSVVCMLIKGKVCRC